MSDYVKVASVAEIPDPGKQMLEVEDSVVVLCHVEGRFYCLDDVCTHDGGPLGEGRLCDHAIACPRHGAQFDIRTGQPLTMPAIVPTRVHDVKVEGDDVYVRINEGVSTCR